jgi:hypothetical protein
MAAKSLPPFQIFTNGSMTGTNVLTSLVTDIRNLDNVAISLTWTGNPNGTFTVDGSVDGTNWVSLTLSPGVTAAGTATSALINLTGLAFAFIRTTYTNSSSTGTLNGWISAKGV